MLKFSSKTTTKHHLKEKYRAFKEKEQLNRTIQPNLLVSSYLFLDEFSLNIHKWQKC